MHKWPNYLLSSSPENLLINSLVLNRDRSDPMNGGIQRPIRFVLHKTLNVVHCSREVERERNQNQC